MYVILVNDDNNLTAPKKERIMQRSKLVDTLWFLVPPFYKEHDMSVCTVMLEYVLPVSRKYKTEILELSDERYEEYLKYTVPFDTDLTTEAGKIELQLTFVYADIDVNGNDVQHVRKTSTTFINIVPISAWSDIIPDSSLSALDQRLIKVDSQIKALNDYAEILGNSQVDNLKYDAEDETLQLMAGENGIGDKVSMKDIAQDGLPIVNLDSASDDDSNKDDDSSCMNDVVEF